MGVGLATGHGTKDGTRDTEGDSRMVEIETNLRENEIAMYAPFSPKIFKVRMPSVYIQHMNGWMDTVVADPDLRKSHDHSHKLAGNLRYEMKMEEDVWNYKPPTEKLSLGQWIENLVKNYVKKISEGIIIPSEMNDTVVMKDFTIQEGWINDQYAGDFNPLHQHGGDISSVTFLRVPESITKGKEREGAGYLVFADGRCQKYTSTNFVQLPIEGIIYIFPNWLLHTVYPFRGEGVRRSMSFNAKVSTNHDILFFGQ